MGRAGRLAALFCSSRPDRKSDRRRRVKAAAKYLKPDNATFGLFIPTKSPNRTKVPMLADLGKTIGNYRGRQDVALGEAFDVSPENIDKHTKIETLPSGLKAALLEKKTRGHEIDMRLTLRYGDVKNLNGKVTAGQVLPHLMIRGTKSLSHQQIQDELDKLRATLHVEGSAGEVTFSVVTRQESFPAVLKLLGQILREPTLPENELELVKQAELAELEQGVTDPRTLALNVVKRHLAPYQKGDPRYVATPQESIEMLKAVTAADVKQLYANFLSGAHGELAIVGDFDAAKTVPILNSILSGWKAEMPYAHISRSVESESTGGYKQIETPDKANAMYFGALVFPMKDDDSDFAPLSLGDFILGSGTLSSRLGDRIREKEDSRTASLRRWVPRPRISGRRCRFTRSATRPTWRKSARESRKRSPASWTKAFRRPSWRPPRKAICSKSSSVGPRTPDSSTSCARISWSTAR